MWLNTRTLYLLHMLLWRMTDTLILKVGDVVSPVSWANIHIFLNPKECGPDFDKIDAVLNRLSDSLVDISTSTKKKLNKLSFKASVIKKELFSSQALLETLFKDPTKMANYKAEEYFETKTVGKRFKREPVTLALIGLGVLVLSAVGLGIYNMYQLNELAAKAEQRDQDFESLIFTLDRSSVQADKNFIAFNNTIDQLVEDVTLHRNDQVLDNIFTRLHLYRLDVLRRQDNCMRGLASAHQGMLDPTFMDITEIQEGIQKVGQMAEMTGRKLAPVPSWTDLVFGQRISVHANKTGVHLFIHIPLLEKHQEMFELLAMENHVVHLADDLNVEVELEQSELIIVDTQRLEHIIVSKDALDMHCQKLNGVFYCPFRAYMRKPAHCISAFLLKDTEKMNQLCHKKIKTMNEMTYCLGSNVVQVHTEQSHLYRLKCTDIDKNRVFRINGTDNVTLAEGCRLEGNFMTMYSREADLRVDMPAPHYEASDVLEGLTHESLITAAKQIHELRGVKTLDVSFKDIKDHIANRHVAFTQTGHTGGLIAIGVLTVVIVGFLVYGCYKHCSWTKDEGQRRYVYGKPKKNVQHSDCCCNRKKNSSLVVKEDDDAQGVH